MKIIICVLITAVIAFGPRLMVLLSDKVKPLGMLGPIFLCYALGIVLGAAFHALSFDVSIATSFVNYTIPVAIPLMLFSANLNTLKMLAKPVLKSFLLMCISVVIVSSLGYCIFYNRFDHASAISGMMVGLYTGGTPNLIAIANSLKVPNALTTLAIAADTVAGGIYFLLLISVMPKLVRKFLLPFRAYENRDAALETKLSEEFVPKKQAFSVKAWMARVPAVLFAIGCFGLSALLALVITGSLDNNWVVVIVMLTVTTLGILFSFVKKVRNAPGSFSTGQYLIYMFSVAMGLTLDFSLFTYDLLMLFIFFCFVQFATIFVHILLAKLFKIDADTTLITSTAGIYGPAFIAPAAGAMNNKDLILPGLITGILGYAAGNYLGIGVAFVLSLFA